MNIFQKHAFKPLNLHEYITKKTLEKNFYALKKLFTLSKHLFLDSLLMKLRKIEHSDCITYQSYNFEKVNQTLNV